MSIGKRVTKKTDQPVKIVDRRIGKIILGGWFQGKDTYLWIGDENDRRLAFIDGQRLYRLAKAIVRHYEIERPA